MNRMTIGMHACVRRAAAFHGMLQQHAAAHIVSRACSHVYSDAAAAAEHRPSCKFPLKDMRSKGAADAAADDGYSGRSLARRCCRLWCLCFGCCLHTVGDASDDQRRPRQLRSHGRHACSCPTTHGSSVKCAATASPGCCCLCCQRLRPKQCSRGIRHSLHCSATPLARILAKSVSYSPKRKPRHPVGGVGRTPLEGWLKPLEPAPPRPPSA